MRRETARKGRESLSALLTMLPKAPPSSQELRAATKTASGEGVPEKGDFEGKSAAYPQVPGGVVSKTLKAGPGASALSQTTHDALKRLWCGKDTQSPCCPLLATEITTLGAESAHKLQSPEGITLADFFFGPRYHDMLRSSGQGGDLPVQVVRQLCARDRDTDPIGVALWLVRDLIAAVNCLHESGYIHGDIKEENVLADCRRAPAFQGRTCVRWTAVLFDLDTLGRSEHGPRSAHSQWGRYTRGYVSPSRVAAVQTESLAKSRRSFLSIWSTKQRPRYDAWADDFFATSVTIGNFLAGRTGLLQYLGVRSIVQEAPRTPLNSQQTLRTFASAAVNAGLAEGTMQLRAKTSHWVPRAGLALLAAHMAGMSLANVGFPIVDWTQYYLQSYRLQAARKKYPKLASVMVVLTKVQKVMAACKATPTFTSEVDAAWENLCQTIADSLTQGVTDEAPAEPAAGASAPPTPRARDTGGSGDMTVSCIAKVAPRDARQEAQRSQGFYPLARAARTGATSQQR